MKPLEQLTILDLSRVLACPFASMILAELGLHGVQKLPFTCSYLPGKSNAYRTFWLCLGLLLALYATTGSFEVKGRLVEHHRPHAQIVR